MSRLNNFFLYLFISVSTGMIVPLSMAYAASAPNFELIDTTSSPERGNFVLAKFQRGVELLTTSPLQGVGFQTPDFLRRSNMSLFIFEEAFLTTSIEITSAFNEKQASISIYFSKAAAVLDHENINREIFKFLTGLFLEGDQSHPNIKNTQFRDVVTLTLVDEMLKIDQQNPTYLNPARRRVLIQSWQARENLFDYYPGLDLFLTFLLYEKKDTSKNYDFLKRVIEEGRTSLDPQNIFTGALLNAFQLTLFVNRFAIALIQGNEPCLQEALCYRFDIPSPSLSGLHDLYAIRHISRFDIQDAFDRKTQQFKPFEFKLDAFSIKIIRFERYENLNNPPVIEYSYEKQFPSFIPTDVAENISLTKLSFENSQLKMIRDDHSVNRKDKNLAPLFQGSATINDETYLILSNPTDGLVRFVISFFEGNIPSIRSVHVINPDPNIKAASSSVYMGSFPEPASLWPDEELELTKAEFVNSTIHAKEKNVPLKIHFKTPKSAGPIDYLVMRVLVLDNDISQEASILKLNETRPGDRDFYTHVAQFSVSSDLKNHKIRLQFEGMNENGYKLDSNPRTQPYFTPHQFNNYEMGPDEVHQFDLIIDEDDSIPLTISGGLYYCAGEHVSSGSGSSRGLYLVADIEPGAGWPEDFRPTSVSLGVKLNTADQHIRSGIFSLLNDASQFSVRARPGDYWYQNDYELFQNKSGHYLSNLAAGSIDLTQNQSNRPKFYRKPIQIDMHHLMLTASTNQNPEIQYEASDEASESFLTKSFSTTMPWPFPTKSSDYSFCAQKQFWTPNDVTFKLISPNVVPPSDLPK
ncbi:MAG: hypothetical protein HY390_06050 [Deltaproteobacteria bacterium]|nr:hypothetical protein [Deltaproteobacteria bacterium]